MLISETEQEALATLQFQTTDELPLEMECEIVAFNIELSELLHRIEQLRNRTVDLTYVSDLSQLCELRQIWIADCFSASVDAVNIAQRRLDLLSSLDEHTRLQVKIAKRRLENLVGRAMDAFRAAGLTRKQAEAAVATEADVLEAVQTLNRLHRLPSLFRTSLNLCPESIGEFMDSVGCRLQQWANDFVFSSGQNA